MKIYRHKKRGTLYRLFGDATLQCNDKGIDNEEMVIYCSYDDYDIAPEKWYVRPKKEFFDGRFEEV